MKTRKKTQLDPYRLNRQFVRAYRWLRTNKFVRSAAELALKMEISKGTVSMYLNNKRRLGLINATKFEELVLSRYKHKLIDFDTDILVRQAKLVRTPTPKAISSFTSTQLLVLEGGQELILDKLLDLEKQMGELRDLVTKLIQKASS